MEKKGEESGESGESEEEDAGVSKGVSKEERAFRLKKSAPIQTDGWSEVGGMTMVGQGEIAIRDPLPDLLLLLLQFLNPLPNEERCPIPSC